MGTHKIAYNFFNENTRSALRSEELFKNIFFTISFFAFLFPFSISVGMSGLSANYLFILFPLFFMITKGKFQLPNQTFQKVMIIYFLVLIIAIAYQFSYFEFINRRVISFIIFMSMFSYMFIKIDSRIVRSFKLAIVAIALYFSFKTATLFLSLGGIDLGFSAKGEVGSQRFGFVYVLAIWVLFHYVPKSKIFFILKFGGIMTLCFGLLLTFSRSGIVSIIGSTSLYITYNLLKWFKSMKLPKIKYIFKVVFFIFIFTIFYIVICKYFSVTLDYYGERLFSLKQASGADTFDFDNPDASEGYRFFMFQKVVEFITYNPLTGSGYLGVWILFDDLEGSTHNQYLDVLFRTGIIGIILYLFLIYRLLKYLHLIDPGLFWGFIGILIYGLFHETFKLSQGAFILAFLMGLMAQARSVESNEVVANC